MSGYSMGRQTALEPGTPVSEDAAFRPFWDTYHTINERYAGGEVDRDAIVQGAIRGMIDALGDPYSSYLTSEEYHDTLQGISGEFEGIGVEIATQAADGTQGCATLGSGLPAGDRGAARRLARGEGRPPHRGLHPRSGRRVASTD